MPETCGDRFGAAGSRAIIFSLIVITAAALPTRAATSLALTQDGDPVPPILGLAGAEISDIVWSGRYLWVATEQGLARLDPEMGDGLSQEHWLTFTELNGLGRGAVSALAAVGDTVWVGTVFVETLGGQQVQIGDGLSYSNDGGINWVHIPNAEIFDPSRPGFESDTTPVNNGCFGLAIDAGMSIWATFFAGSSMHSSDGGRSWKRVLPDGADTIIYGRPDVAADSLDILADSLFAAGASDDSVEVARAAADSLRRQRFVHRTFSVLAYDDTVWIGTSGGLARSFDGGASWRNSRVRVDADGVPLRGQISGEWILSIERQRFSGSSVVWAGTNVSEGLGQVAGISSTSDNGETWRFGGPTFAWDFAFGEDGRVWATTDAGLFITDDGGSSWRRMEVADPDTRNTLRGTFNGLASTSAADGTQTIWVGAENGMGRSADGGETWQILAFSLRTLAIDSGELIGDVGLIDPQSSRTYAAPNPFDPSEGERAKLVYSLADDAAVTIDVFDFASRPVIRLLDGVDRAGGRNHGDSWDGRDDDGDVVANGVYFYRIATGAGKQAFGKVVVLD